LSVLRRAPAPARCLRATPLSSTNTTGRATNYSCQTIPPTLLLEFFLHQSPCDTQAVQCEYRRQEAKPIFFAMSLIGEDYDFVFNEGLAKSTKTGNFYFKFSLL